MTYETKQKEQQKAEAAKLKANVECEEKRLAKTNRRENLSTMYLKAETWAEFEFDRVIAGYTYKWWQLDGFKIIHKELDSYDPCNLMIGNFKLKEIQDIVTNVKSFVYDSIGKFIIIVLFTIVFDMYINIILDKYGLSCYFCYVTVSTALIWFGVHGHMLRKCYALQDVDIDKIWSAAQQQDKANRH